MSETQQSAWNQLIREARLQLGESELRTGRLRAAIRYFERQERTGAPFPVGEQPTKTGKNKLDTC